MIGFTMPGPGKISSTSLLFGASVILMVLTVAPGYVQPTPDNHSTAQMVPEHVVVDQPMLWIPPEDLGKNDGNPQVMYCLSGNSDATYQTYVYVWSFSDSTVAGRVLGYPSHSWDYEPIIVRIDKGSSKTTYIYDAGHYRARSTSNAHFTVVTGTHAFKPSQEPVGKKLGSKHFEQLTPETLKIINSRLEKLPRIPFRPGLSLSWACNAPWEVERANAFSGPETVGRIPPQVNAIAGLCIGLIVVVASWVVVRMVRDSRTWYGFRVAGCGLCGGIVGGVVGFETVFAIASAGVLGTIAMILSILAGTTVGTGASGLAGTIVRVKIPSVLVAGGISSSAATILTATW